ncbi:MAG TPA: glycosyltransferase [Iamia sp.]|nr:glycosyltransferase [Iamia sp.]
MTRPLRILHVLEALEGGTSRHVVDLVRWTPGVEQHVAIPEQRVGGLTDEAAAPALRAHGAEIHPVAMTRSPATPANARSLAALVRLVRRLRPDVVHTHSSIGGLLGRVAGAAVRVPAVYTPNGVTDVRAGVLVEQALRPVTARLVAVSTSEADRVRRLRLVRADRVRVVPNGVDLERHPPPFDLRAHVAVPPDAPLVGTISRLVPQKDPLTWVAMAARVVEQVPDAHFVIVGDGALRDEVTTAVDRAGLDERLHLVPHLPEADRALTSLDVFAMSSVFEGAPYAPMEAMRAGVPIVLTDVAGSADLVDDGVDGRIVPARDPGALAAAVVEQLTDRPLAESRAARARCTVADRFGGPAMGRRTRDVYAEVARH